MREEGLKTFRF